MKHCYIAIGLLYLSKQEKITAKFVEVKSFAVAEVQKISQTCGCGPPVAILRNLRLLK